MSLVMDGTAGGSDVARAPLVHIVDDDDMLRQSLGRLLEDMGIESQGYRSASAFLDELDARTPAVVVLDVRVPGLSGFQLQERLSAMDYPAPVVFCSACCDIPTSVRAMQLGAVDFLEKPYDPQRMLELLQSQLIAAARRFREHDERRRIQARLAPLTPREREVLRLVIDGLPSQVIAHELGASVKTIDVHRTRIKAKTDAASLGELARDVLSHRVAV